MYVVMVKWFYEDNLTEEVENGTMIFHSFKSAQEWDTAQREYYRYTGIFNSTVELVKVHD